MSHQPERALTRRHTGIDGGAGVCRNESSAREGIDTLCTPFATIMITEVEMSHQPERALTLRPMLIHVSESFSSRNESSAREGIDTGVFHSLFHTTRYRRNESSAREGIDTV